VQCFFDGEVSAVASLAIRVVSMTICIQKIQKVPWQMEVENEELM
jgi:hypothetical protein